MINAWKNQAIEGMAGVFCGNAEAVESTRYGEVEKLHTMIDQPIV